MSSVAGTHVDLYSVSPQIPGILNCASWILRVGNSVGLAGLPRSDRVVVAVDGLLEKTPARTPWKMPCRIPVEMPGNTPRCHVRSIAPGVQFIPPPPLDSDVISVVCLWNAYVAVAPRNAVRLRILRGYE